MEGRIYYPITPSQHTIFLSRKYSMHKSIINIPTSIIIKKEMDMDLLEEALRMAIERWDCFGLRLVKDKESPKQYFAERKVESIERLNFSGKTRETMERAFLRLGTQKMEIYESPMARFYILKTPEGYGGLFSVINHLIMDSFAISMFYRDCIKIYYALKDQAPFPKAVTPYEEVLKKEVLYRQTPEYQKALQYWQEEFGKDEPMFTHINGREVLSQFRKKKGNEQARFAGSYYLRSTAGHDLYWISKEEVGIMEKFLEAYQFPSLQVMFQMGLRTYLAKVNDHEPDVSMYNMVPRRRNLMEKSTGGTRTHVAAFRTIMPPETTFLKGCRMLFEKQKEQHRHEDFSPMEMFQVEKSRLPADEGQSYRACSFSFSAVPQKTEIGPEIETRWYGNGAVAQPFYLTVMDGDGTGGLKCYYEYMSNVIPKERIQDVHRYMTKVMLEGARNPLITLKDLYQMY